MGPRGWTQQQLADALGVTVKTINTLEGGRAKGMRAGTKARLEDVLGWIAGDVDRVLAGAQPRVRPGWVAGEASVTEENSRPEGEIDRRSVAELIEAGEAPLLSVDPEALRGLTEEQQATVIREAQEHALRVARLLRGDR